MPLKQFYYNLWKKRETIRKKPQSRRNCFRPAENYYNSTYFVKSYVVLYNKTFIAWMFGKYEDLFPQKNHIFLGHSPREIWYFFGGGKSSHFPHHHASKCIMAFVQFFKITTNGFYIITKMDSTSIHCLLCVNPNKWIYIITLFYAQSLQIDSTSLHKWILHHHHYTLSFMHKSIRMII